MPPSCQRWSRTGSRVLASPSGGGSNKFGKGLEAVGPPGKSSSAGRPRLCQTPGIQRRRWRTGCVGLRPGSPGRSLPFLAGASPPVPPASERRHRGPARPDRRLAADLCRLFLTSHSSFSRRPGEVRGRSPRPTAPPAQANLSARTWPARASGSADPPPYPALAQPAPPASPQDPATPCRAE